MNATVTAPRETVRYGFTVAMVLFFVLANIAMGAYILAKHYTAFHQWGLAWFVFGLAAVTVFAISLLQHVHKGDIPARVAMDLTVRALLGSSALLMAIGELLRG